MNRLMAEKNNPQADVKVAPIECDLEKARATWRCWYRCARVGAARQAG